jgi:hypothetical protein
MKKEQLYFKFRLEKLGWKFLYEENEIIRFEKNGALVKWDIKIDNIKIYTINESMDTLKYNGYCGDIKTFKIIWQLINFKI